MYIRNPGNSPVIYNPSASQKATCSPNTNSEGSKTEKFDISNPNGGLMALKDKANMIDLKCDQLLVNPDNETNLFGPDYPTNDVNYSTIIVRCPANCHKMTNSLVYGLGIHPRESPICLSAIVDNAMSLYGGIFSISLFSGYDKYELHPDINPVQNGISVKTYGDSKKSYVLAKIDNVDLVKKDFRILNSDGELSASGRIEMRFEGKWGTICSIGNDKLSAKVICRDIGYKDGEWKTPENNEGKEICRNFNNGDHCGAEASRPIFSNIACLENTHTFNDCQKQIADPLICNHGFDAIISCYIDNFTVLKDIPDKTVRLESSLNINTGKAIIGRLELYLRGKYEPVCNIGFKNISAIIACKQMGYTSGKVVEAAQARQFQLELTSKREFNAINFTCKGDEAFVSECQITVNNIACKHDQDVVIICDGIKGDPSGKSQYIKKGPIPLPKLSKLGIPTRNINCDTKGYELFFRGDPGSIYLVNCPENCGDKSGLVWGTGVYTSDSYICKSALHGGIIGPGGGNLMYIRTYGQKFYKGSLQNGGYLSTDIGIKDWPVSFSLSSVNSGWINASKLLSSSSSFIFSDEVGSESTREFSLTNKDHRVYQKGSFLELSSREEENKEEIPKPVFKWTPPNFTFKFTSLSNIEIAGIQETLKDYTIIFKFELTDFKKESAFIISLGCGGYNIYVSKRGLLKIGDFCDMKSFWTPGYNVPLNDEVIVYLRYSNNTTNIRIQSLKVKESFEATNLTTNLTINKRSNLITIGKIYRGDKHHFLGNIKFFYIFKGEIPFSVIPSLAKLVKIINHNAIVGLSKTVDKRICVSRCSDNPTPPNPGCGETPKDADLNGNETNVPIKFPKIDLEKLKVKDDKKVKPKPGSENESSKQDNKKTDQTDKNKPISDSTTDPKKVNNLEALSLNCETNLLDKKFGGITGTMFRADCPDCSNDKTIVFGTAIFHPKSSICKAAQHSGALNKGEAGLIVVTIIGPKPIFQGSEGNDGTLSVQYQGSERSFSLKRASPITKISCYTKANQRKFETYPTGKEFVLKCPKKCSEIREADIYGTEIFTDSSSICRAAIHEGIINDLGGEVKIAIAEGKDNYKATNGFGIHSKEFGPHVRSFRFLGNKAAINFKYKEDYTGKFKDKWELEKYPNVRHPDDDTWDFFEDKKNLDKNGKQDPIFAIKHTGKISTKAVLPFASWVFLKDQEWANGTVKFNFLLKDLNSLGFLFRYKNFNNYYAVSFNPNSSRVKFISKFEGKLT